MNIFIYSDESGVFDKNHEQFYVYGGLVLIGKEEKDNAVRRYIAMEKEVRNTIKAQGELKANMLNPKNKRRLFSSLNMFTKWGAVIGLDKVHEEIFKHKKSKQRYLDYAYKMSVKNTLKILNNLSIIKFDEIENVYIFCDEHTTATNGKYELKESLEQEFIYGTFNNNYQVFYKPILPDLKSISLEYRNSEKTALIRAADIIANNIYFHAKQDKLKDLRSKIMLTHLP